MSNVVAIATARPAPTFNPAKLPGAADDVFIGKTYRAKLTKESVDRLPLAPDGVYIVKDAGRRGLELRVTKNAKTFYCRARMGGREDGNNRAKPVRLGTADELQGYAQVWSLYDTVRADVRTKGRDYNAEHAAAREEFKRTTDTPRAYWDRYKVGTAHHGRDKLRPATLKNYGYCLPAMLGDYMDRPMDALTPAVVSRLFAEARDRVGVSSARTGLRTLRAIQNRFDLPNTTTKAFKEHPEARSKAKEKLPRVNMEQAPTLAAWLLDFRTKHAAGSIKHSHADLLMLAMLTGLRDRPLRNMEWAWLDLAHGLIRVPAFWMKNGLDAELPLSAKAVEVLTARREFVKSERYVFPSVRDARKPMGRDSKFFALLPWKLGAHDCRKAMGTILANHPGVTYANVKALLTHTDGDVTGLYAKSTWQGMREASNALAGVLFPA